MTKRAVLKVLGVTATVAFHAPHPDNGFLCRWLTFKQCAVI